MNYDELKDFIIETTNASALIVGAMDHAIDTMKDEQIGLAINSYNASSNLYENDAVFARELIDYIDGLRANQDNGDES
tara:strand:+ start:22181 stop:22414 length:234 start_codon:yes stop_codon:yes gene_type:complete